jgi:hypothetical protein
MHVVSNASSFCYPLQCMPKGFHGSPRGRSERQKQQQQQNRRRGFDRGRSRPWKLRKSGKSQHQKGQITTSEGANHNIRRGKSQHQKGQITTSESAAAAGALRVARSAMEAAKCQRKWRAQSQLAMDPWISSFPAQVFRRLKQTVNEKKRSAGNSGEESP